MKLSSRVLVAALAAAIAIPFAAQAAKGERRNKKTDSLPAFTTVDKDSNGSITKEEFMAALKEKLGDGAEAKFTTLDKDKDGKLSKDEYAAASQTEKKRRRKNQ